MNIRDAEEILFSEWEQDREGFVRDGVVNESNYFLSKPKVVFILKEVNDLNGGGWDLREFVSKGARPQTWDNIARWVCCLNSKEKIPQWKEIKNITNEFRVRHLKGVCVMNLKKSPGTHTANHLSLDKVANEDKEYIRRQYALYEPDITICCGTADLFKQVLGHEVQKWEMTSRGIQWYERSARKYVVSFSHPEARVYDPLLVYSLLDAVNEIYTFT